MKMLTLFVALHIGTTVFAQTKTETEIIQLSNDKFRWGMNHDADSMASMLDDHFVGISSSGIRRSKKEYLDNIKNRSTIHNSMQIQETSVSVFGNTAILTGKGRFVITANSIQSTQHLFYMQVFIKRKQDWKLVALQGSRLPD